MYLMLSYYISDVITLSCWLNFYYHLNILCKGKFDPAENSKIKVMEKLIIALKIAIWTLYFRVII